MVQQFEREQVVFLAGTAGHPDREGIGQAQQAAWLRRLAGANLADRMFRIDDALKHDLDLPAGFLDAEEAGLDHLGIVEDKQVAGTQQAGQVGEATVCLLQALHMQKTAAGTFRCRMLGDQFGGEMKVEIVDGQRHGLFTGNSVTGASAAGRRLVRRPGIVQCDRREIQ